MTTNKIYSLLLAGVLAAFFLGLFFAPNDSKVVKDQWQKERKLLMDEVVKKQVEITALDNEMANLRRKRTEDSIAFASIVARAERDIAKYKKQYEAVNLHNASALDLDSIRAYLRANPLHSIR